MKKIDCAQTKAVENFVGNVSKRTLLRARRSPEGSKILITTHGSKNYNFAVGATNCHLLLAIKLVIDRNMLKHLKLFRNKLSKS